MFSKQLNTIEADIVIIGSGAGGATIANELSKSNKKIIVLEKGQYPKRLGSTLSSLKYYDKFALSRSKENIIIYRTIMAGGTTVVSCGNAVRSLQKEFLEYGIDLETSFREAENELKVKSIADKHIIGASRKMMEAANELGYKMKPITKFNGFDQCISCGNCIWGCKYNAKWTALSYLDQAINNGVEFIPNVTVNRVVSANGIAKGVEIKSIIGNFQVLAEKVILCAGGIGTPIILQKSGIENAGENLFCDLFNITYGRTINISQTKEIPMATIIDQFSDFDDFILSPFIDPIVAFLLVTNWRNICGLLPHKNTIGIMTKIADESNGKVFSDGKISKSVTTEDKIKLEKGAVIAKEILIEAGADPRSIFITKPRGAHPGGTAAIGIVVSNKLETEIKNLYICDASLFPCSMGLPPILTIVALAKWFSKNI